MNSARLAVAFLCTVSFAACHRKSQATGTEAGPSGTDNADGGTAADAAAETAAADDGAADGSADAAAIIGDDGGDNGDDGGGTGDDGGPSTVVSGGHGFAGSYNCFGILNLMQTGTTVAGDGTSRSGNKTHSIDINCKAVGDRCTGVVNHFTSVNGSPPKPAGKGRVTFHIVNGGLEYTEGAQKSFCARR
jgi:hypothetical protein